ncbi:PEP-CTERM sorting domain-containing protein [Desulfobacterales bacterium HSG16]|nr:PEP-CTERM sorting domain-containing protein [Desulfobacterales bacterium HSG16]
MKKFLFLAAVFLTLVILPLNVLAYSVDLTSHESLSGGAWADVTGDGTDTITFDLWLETGTIADIRGFFFDFEDFSGLSDVNVTDLTDMNNDFSLNNVITSWPGVSGNAGMQGAGDFDFGIEFGDGGIGNGKGDIRAITFSILGNADMTLGSDFGMRLMSFGENRDGSRKMIGSPGDPGTNPAVPEPSTMILLSLGLIGGILGARRKFKR